MVLIAPSTNENAIDYSGAIVIRPRLVRKAYRSKIRIAELAARRLSEPVEPRFK
jgi:hypothetical protein